MSHAKVFNVENRLAKVVKLPGGKTVAEAIKGADERVASVKDDCLASLSAQGARLQRLAEAGKSGDGGAVMIDLYATANEVFSLSAAFGMTELAEAAYSLCDLADPTREGEAINWPAIDVHIDGVRFLASAAGASDTPIRREIIKGLREVAARYAIEA